MSRQKEKPSMPKIRIGKSGYFFRILTVCCLMGVLMPGMILILQHTLGTAGCLAVGIPLCILLGGAAALILYKPLRVLIDRDQDLVKQLHAVSKDARQHMLLQLLQRDVAGAEKAEEFLRQSNIRFSGPWYCAAVLKIDDFWMASEDYSDQDIALFRFSMENIATELLEQHMGVCRVENGMDYLTFILNLDRKPEEGKLAGIFREAIRHEADYFGIGFSAGIGTVGEGISSVSESYNNALDAVEYRLFFGKLSVTEYESIKDQESVHIDYPYEMEQEILRQAMRFHNRVKTMEFLDKFLEQVAHISAEDANLYIHQLGVAINRALRQADGIQVTHLYSMREFSHFLEALTTIKEKQQQIKATLDELFHITAEDSSRKKQGIVQKVEEFVVQNYQNPDITLEDMAMHAGLSSNYIRRIFREQCGYSPMDFLVNYRIEMAKDLLKNTSYTAREIAGMVGYANSKYFYSLFKKQTGYTTYEYKNSGKQGDLSE